MAADPPVPLFWTESPADALQRLQSRPEGLSEAEAAARLAKWGLNQLKPEKPQALLIEFLKRFRNPLVIILLLASAVSAATGDIVSFAIIGSIVLMSVTLDFVQEHRAQKAAASLRRSVAVHTSVLRDGKAQDRLPQDLVPGDVVQLSAGDLIPADGLVLTARDCFVNQALLTGEAYPVEKRPSDSPKPDVPLMQADNAVFMGTAVLSGSATVLIGETGPRTALGDIAASLQSLTPPTAFERGTRDFGMLIMRLTILLVLFVLLVNLLTHKPLLESFLFAIALAVGLTPELLPMVVSVTLARGALRLSKEQVIVKRLSAIEDLGSMDVLCTDKTGTLTEAHIRLEKHVDAAGADSQRVLRLAYLNSFFESGLKSPLDAAILAHGEIDVAAVTKIDEVPFDFERRCVSVLVDEDGHRPLIVKGAPENIIGLCTEMEDPALGTPVALDAGRRAALLKQFDAFGEEGFRVLAIAWRHFPNEHIHAAVADEQGLIFAGFAAFLDPPKASAAQAIAALCASGVTVKIVTGDNERVTHHVCAELGIPVEGTLLGTAMQTMDDQALSALVETTNVFCRVNPAQKNRIILALRARGHTVGYIGDGINDAPSLHSADIGISVDQAVDVAKDAADLIMLQQDLNVLCRGVAEGRRTFRNVMKYILMGTSSNFGNMFSMAGAALFLPFLPMLPMQILLNNLIYDLSEIAIPLDTVDAAETARPSRWDMSFIQKFMLVIGPISSLFDFGTFFLLLWVFHASETLFHTGWFIESMATQILVIFVIRTRQAPWRSRPSRPLVLTALACLALAILLPISPLGGLLGFVTPPALFWLILPLMVGTYLALVEWTKRAFFRHWVRTHG